MSNSMLKRCCVTLCSIKVKTQTIESNRLHPATPDWQGFSIFLNTQPLQWVVMIERRQYILCCHVDITGSKTLSYQLSTCAPGNGCWTVTPSKTDKSQEIKTREAEMIICCCDHKHFGISYHKVHMITSITHDTS